MMKRGLLITFAVIISSKIGVAEDIHILYARLVDYVNCKYAIIYIDKKRSEINSSDYIKDFEKYKKAFTSNVKSYTDIYKGIDKKVKSSTTIYNALKKSAYGFQKAKELWEYIEQKKAKYSQDWTREELIDHLILLSDDIEVSGQKIKYKSFLSAAAISLKVDLNKQIPDKLINKEGEIIDKELYTKEKEIKDVNFTSTTDVKSKVHEKDSEINPEKGRDRRLSSQDSEAGDSQSPTVKLFIIILLAFLCFMGYKKRESIVRLLKSFNSKFISKQEINESGNQKKIKELQLENSTLRDFEQQNSQLQKRIKQLEIRIIELERKNIQKRDFEIIQRQPVIISPVNEKKENFTENTRLFADAIIGGEFHLISERPNEDTVYVLFKSSSARIAEFSVYEGSHKRVIDTPDFVDGCDKQKINAHPQDIKVEPGEAFLDNDGKWKIIKKANIIFI